MDDLNDFVVECAVCKNRLENWVGSTPCCGSIAYLVSDDGTVTDGFMLFGSLNGSPIVPTKISTSKNSNDETPDA